MERGLKSKMSRSSQLWASYSIIFSVFVLYSQVIASGPLWDDNVYIFKNKALMEAKLWEFWVPGLYSRSWPLVYSLWWGLVRVFGDNTFYYHLLSIIVHCLNCLLIYQLCPRYKWWMSFLFAVHPLNVEVVAWMCQLNTLLCVFFFLLHLWFLKKGHRFASVTSFIASLGCKSLFILWPLLLKNRLPGRQWVALLFISGLAGARTVYPLFENYEVLSSFMHLSSLKRQSESINILNSYCFYLQKIFLPLGQSFFHNPPAFSGGVVVLFLFMAWIDKKTMFCFLIFLAPVIGLIKIPFHEWSHVAERWSYHAMLPIGYFLQRHLQVKNVVKIFIVFVFTMKSYFYVKNFSSERRLFVSAFINYENKQKLIDLLMPYHRQMVYVYRREGKEKMAINKMLQWRSFLTMQGYEKI